MEGTGRTPLHYAARSIGFVFKLLLLLGLLIIATFAVRLIIPENFGIFKEIRIALAAVGAVVALNYILTHFYAKYILWSLAMVWLADVVLFFVWALRP